MLPVILCLDFCLVFFSNKIYFLIVRVMYTYSRAYRMSEEPLLTCGIPGCPLKSIAFCRIKFK
jgi:hypothetical protein